MYMKSCVLGTVSILSVQQTSSKKVVIFVDNLMGIAREELFQTLRMNDKYGHDVVVSDIFLDAEHNRIIVVGDFSEHLAPYYVDYLGGYFRAKKTWRYTDYLYAYDGELGTRVSDKGARVDLTVWAPSANQVSVILYDKDNQNNVLAKLPMTKGAKGEWSISLTSATGLSISDYRGYYYHYEMERDRETVLTLDPYAKSLAAWNSDWIGLDPSHKVAKAAIVDTASIGNQKLDYAHIKGYTKREDAIIYEAHVRDFTSDPAIADDLHHPFGTFSAFIDKLDYLKDLGVTHIQLLPVMSYYFANEFKNDVCLLNYASSNTNYNWGYDPQSYFALTGMYSADPQDPQERIAEFKDLVHAIHERGMGVILDVVYNHTADLAILEDLEPNYYHFMEEDGTAKTSFGGGRPGTTHYMTRRLVMDSVLYWVKEFKVDGFRFDMMGDLDAQTVQMAYDAAKKLNPNIIMLGEGWISYAGDSNDWRQPADQTWMSQTDSVGSFSDDMRNLLKSGYPSEGSPAFLTGGARPLNLLFNNIKAQPNNFLADDPGDVVQYIAAHDNLTLHDVIAKSIHKDPSIPKHEAEIQRRLRLGNALILTSQGTAFIHSGQEYGRTKQFRDEAYRGPVALDQVPAKSDYLTYEDGTPFDYPYFISDSYDSTDAINHFDWSKATDSDHYPDNTQSRAYTKGLIHLRRSTDAFTLATREMIDQNVSLITIPNENGIGYDDLVIAYQTLASNGDRYAVFINADSVARHVFLTDAYKDLLAAEVVVDGEQAGVEAIPDPSGVTMTEDGLTLDSLTTVVLRLKENAS